MEFGVTIRNMGAESTPALMAQCAVAAERAGFESLWITDHIAIPPDDAQGSGGRYVDPLVTLAWMAGQTSRIRLGTGVLILPYRGMLATAKQVASLQELSGERLLLGVGIGWMDPEFRAVGVPRRSRGAVSDATLEFLNECFANEVVTANGQPFLFKPRPAKPPILIGGRAPHALKRAARLGDGWLPMASKPESLARDMVRYGELCADQGHARGSVSLMTGLPLDEPARAVDLVGVYRELGVDRLVNSVRYRDEHAYEDRLGVLARVTGVAPA